MPKAIFLAPVPEGTSNFTLPPLSDPEGGIQLYYDDNGTLRGGYSAIGQVPQAPNALVLIHSSQATIDAMDADDDYLWIEDVVEEVEQP